MKETIRAASITFSYIFTFLTITDSVLHLDYGESNDTFFYILDRALVVLIAILMYNIVKNIKVNMFFKILIHYLVTICLMGLLSMAQRYYFDTRYSCDFFIRNYRERFWDDNIIYMIVLIAFADYNEKVKKIRKKRNNVCVPKETAQQEDRKYGQ